LQRSDFQSVSPASEPCGAARHECRSTPTRC
jgi:hypothetical protein